MSDDGRRRDIELPPGMGGWVRWVSPAEAYAREVREARRRAIEHAGRCVRDNYDVLEDRNSEAWHD